MASCSVVLFFVFLRLINLSAQNCEDKFTRDNENALSMTALIHLANGSSLEEILNCTLLRNQEINFFQTVTTECFKNEHTTWEEMCQNITAGNDTMYVLHFRCLYAKVYNVNYSDPTIESVFGDCQYFDSGIKTIMHLWGISANDGTSAGTTSISPNTTSTTSSPTTPSTASSMNTSTSTRETTLMSAKPMLKSSITTSTRSPTTNLIPPQETMSTRSPTTNLIPPQETMSTRSPTTNLIPPQETMSTRSPTTNLIPPQNTMSTRSPTTNLIPPQKTMSTRSPTTNLIPPQETMSTRSPTTNLIPPQKTMSTRSQTTKRTPPQKTMSARSPTTTSRSSLTTQPTAKGKTQLSNTATPKDLNLSVICSSKSASHADQITDSPSQTPDTPFTWLTAFVLVLLVLSVVGNILQWFDSNRQKWRLDVKQKPVDAECISLNEDAKAAEKSPEKTSTYSNETVH